MADKTFTQDQVNAAVAEATKGALTQDKVDAIVQDRLTREKAKFADHDELVKFKADHQKELEAATQKELEGKKEYDKLKEGWTKKEQEYKGLITGKDTQLSDMKIGTALMNEIMKNNAYPEETLAMIKSQTTIDKDGNIHIKGKDKNGMDTQHSVEEGVKKFLEGRPHLVKAGKLGGGGTGAGSPGDGGVGGDDLNALNAEFAAASSRGDKKQMGELRTKMNALIGAGRTKLK